MTHMSQLNYWPLAPVFLSILAGIFIAVVVMVELGVLSYAYLRLGISSRLVFLLLLGSLLGSYINIPVAQLPPHQVISGAEVSFFGVRYVIPAVTEWPGTIIAVNIGGAVIPGVLSLYLLIKNRIWFRALVATAAVTTVCHLLARPVPGVGIGIPIFVPPLTAAAIAFLLSPLQPAPLAYIGGSLGTLIGADLLNLGRVQGLDAPIASIGGAGTFDGIFLTGILAVLFASIVGPGPRHRPG